MHLAKKYSELLLKGLSFIDLHFEIFLPCSFLRRGVRYPPLLLGLHHLFNFTSEMNESLIKDAFFKPSFDTQPMAFPSEINYSLATPHCPFPWPSTPQYLCLCLCLHLLFYHNYPDAIYNYLESETQCAVMHSVLNFLRDCLWVNRLKRNWSLVLKWDASNHVTLLFSLLPEHHPLHITTSTSTSAAFTSVKRNIALNSFSCTFYSMQIFLNLTANIIILGTYTHFS